MLAKMVCGALQVSSRDLAAERFLAIVLADVMRGE
jgi:hypothetical protein